MTDEEKQTDSEVQLPDGLASDIKEAAEEVVKDKFTSQLSEIVDSALAGRVDEDYQVVVQSNSTLAWVNEPVETDIGTGEIAFVYPTDDDTISVSVAFSKQDIEENTDYTW